MVAWSLDFGLDEKSWLSRLVFELERRRSPVFSDADMADWLEEKGFASRRGMISSRLLQTQKEKPARGDLAPGERKNEAG